MACHVPSFVGLISDPSLDNGGDMETATALPDTTAAPVETPAPSVLPAPDVLPAAAVVEARPGVGQRLTAALANKQRRWLLAGAAASLLLAGSAASLLLAGGLALQHDRSTSHAAGVAVSKPTVADVLALAPGEQMVPAATAVAASAPAAAASGVVTDVSDATPIAVAAVPASTPASTPASIPRSAPEPSAPALDAEPTMGRVAMPSLGPMLDNPQSQAARAKRQAERLAVQQTDQESQRAAALAAARFVQAAPAIPKPAEQPASLIAKAEAPQIAPQAAPVAANPPIATLPANANANGPFYALATRRLRTTTESEQLAAAMRSLLRAPGGVPLRVDTLAEGKDWRVVSWPYSSRSSAEQARAQLVARGLKVDVVDF
jgi:hypothetical protein